MATITLIVIGVISLLVKWNKLRCFAGWRREENTRCFSPAKKPKMSGEVPYVSTPGQCYARQTSEGTFFSGGKGMFPIERKI
jgi:hypothetical protein